MPPGTGRGTEDAISRKQKALRRALEEKLGKVGGEANGGPKALVREHAAHVLICGGSDCKKRGSKSTKQAIKNELKAAGAHRDVRIDTVKCLGLCKHGPNVIVYPSGTWYLGLREDAASEVARRHLVEGEPVEKLATGFRPVKRR